VSDGGGGLERADEGSNKCAMKGVFMEGLCNGCVMCVGVLVVLFTCG
jgi:hypothetical protein